jgi:hypothetical protein
MGMRPVDECTQSTSVAKKAEANRAQAEVRAVIMDEGDRIKRETSKTARFVVKSI